MRKILFSVALAAVMCLLTSCSDNSPKAVAEKASECMKNGDFESLADIVYIEEKDGSDTDEQRKALVGLLGGFVGKVIESKGGLKEVETLSEEIADDGQNAIVKQRTTYGNGDVDESDVELTKDAQGNWKVKMN